MSVSSFDSVYVEELYLEGKPFTVANFKGKPGDTPVINANGVVGDKGTDWGVRFDYLTAPTPDENETSVYILPDPFGKDKRKPITGTDPVEYEDYKFTMLALYSLGGWYDGTGSSISIMDHNNKFVGKFYGPRQHVNFIAFNKVWNIC